MNLNSYGISFLDWKYYHDRKMSIYQPRRYNDFLDQSFDDYYKVKYCGRELFCTHWESSLSKVKGSIAITSCLNNKLTLLGHFDSWQEKEYFLINSLLSHLEFFLKENRKV